MTIHFPIWLLCVLGVLVVASASVIAAYVGLMLYYAKKLTRG